MFIEIEECIKSSKFEKALDILDKTNEIDNFDKLMFKSIIYTKLHRLDKAKDYAQRAVSTSYQESSLDKKVKALIQLVWCYYWNDQFYLSILTLEKTFENLKKREIKDEIYYSYLGLISIIYALNTVNMFDPSLAQKFSKFGLNVIKLYGSKKELALANWSRGISLFYSKRYLSSIEKLTISDRLFRELDNLWGYTLSSYWLGVVYRFNRNYGKANKFFKIALMGYKKLNNSWGIAYTHNSFGLLFINMNKPKKAKLHFFKALKIRLEFDIDKRSADTSLSIAKLFKTTNEFKKSTKYFQLAFALYYRSHNIKGIIQSSLNLLLRKVYFEKYLKYLLEKFQ